MKINAMTRKYRRERERENNENHIIHKPLLYKLIIHISKLQEKKTKQNWITGTVSSSLKWSVNVSLLSFRFHLREIKEKLKRKLHETDEYTQTVSKFGSEKDFIEFEKYKTISCQCDNVYKLT